MQIAVRVVLAIVGAAIVIGAVASAIKTVVLPRGLPSTITRTVFLTMRRIYLMLAPRRRSYERRDRRLASYAPVSLLAVLATWLGLVLLGYVLLFMAVENVPAREAFDLSGSSLLTLGIVKPVGLAATVLVFTEAALGLFLLALMITYLPSIYGAFQRRELGVTALEVRAGRPPSARELVWRHWRLERMDELRPFWEEWERWFLDVEETHTSLAGIVFFRSPQPDHSWVTAAGAVLDGASLVLSSVDVPREVQAEFCIRAGYLCLRRIATFFRIPFDADPRPEDPISIGREEWEAVLDELAAEGVPLKADRDQAWRDFAGWRVNYDAVLLALASLTSAPPAPWSSDRAGDRTTVQVLRRRGAP
jgi:hypothetical protein